MKKAKEKTPPNLHHRAELENTPTQKTNKSGIGVFLLRLSSLLLVVGVTGYIFSIRDHVQEYAAFGYPGIFLVMLLANATVIIPAPGVAVVFAMGNMFNPFLVGLAAGLGGAIGELSGFLAGFSGQGVVENTKAYERIQPWIQRYGAWVILVLSAFPNPFFDLAGIAAGAAKIKIWKFLVFGWIGQTIKMWAFAYAGAHSISWVTNLFR